MPSNHVWPNFESPVFPHLRNQEPPGAQQLNFPLFLSLPHKRHWTAKCRDTVVCARRVLTVIFIPARQCSEQIKYRIPGCSKAGDSSMAASPPVPRDPNPDDGGITPVVSQLINCDFVTSTTSCFELPYLNQTLSPIATVRRCPRRSLTSHGM